MSLNRTAAEAENDPEAYLGLKNKVHDHLVQHRRCSDWKYGQHVRNRMIIQAEADLR